jgi:TonB family protein
MNSKVLAIVLASLIFFPQHRARSVLHVESFEYPSGALGAQIQGDVTLHAQVEADGHVPWALLASGNLLLGDDAINNLRAWKFEPGDKEIVEVTYHFVLTEPKVFDPRTICKFDLPNTVTVISNPHLPETTRTHKDPSPQSR